MTKFKAVVYEDIPANRLVMLHGADNDPDLDSDKIYLKLAEKDNLPDMVSTKKLEEGQEVTVSIRGEEVWRVELSRGTRPGTLVSCDGDGKIATTNTVDHKFYVGYTIEGGSPGDKVKYVRKTGVIGQSLDEGTAGKIDGEQL